MVLTRDGAWVKPFLLGILDDRSRLVYGLFQAFMKRGLPRALMTDNRAAAMLAEETVAGLQRLGVLHQTTLPYSPYQDGKQESLWGRIEGRLLPTLEGHTPLTLELLNQATQAWAEQEYHRTRLVTEAASRDEFQACLQHLLDRAGNASLMTPALEHTLCDHAVGNYRMLTTLAAALVAVALPAQGGDQQFRCLASRGEPATSAFPRLPVD